MFITFCNQGVSDKLRVNQSLFIFIFTFYINILVLINALICSFKKIKILALCAVSPWGLWLLYRGAFFAVHGPSSLCVDFLNYLGCQDPTTTRSWRAS